MKKSVFSVIFIALLGVSFDSFSQVTDINAHFPIDMSSIQGIVNENARGNEVNIVDGEFRPVTFQGGFGPQISHYELVLHFDFHLPPGPTIVQLINQRTRITKMFQIGDSSEDGYVKPIEEDLYEIMIEGYDVHLNDSYTLKIITPASFNSTPDIGNPTPGYYGPSYGVSNIHRY